MEKIRLEMKKICLLGQYATPEFNERDTNWYKQRYDETWMLNYFYRYWTKIKPDAIFNLHKDIMVKDNKNITEMVGKYNSFNVPVYVIGKCPPALNNTIQFPVDEIVRIYGSQIQSCSFSYMMCFAHYSGFTDITLEAVSMLNQQEYAGQAIGLLNTMDLLEGMGCKITCPMRDAWAKKASASGIEWKNFHPITVYHLIPS